MKRNRGQGQTQKVQSEEKRSTKKYFIGVKSYAPGDKKFKNKSDAKWNKGSGGNLRARHAPPPPLQAKLPTCEEKLKESLSSEGSWMQMSLKVWAEF